VFKLGAQQQQQQHIYPDCTQPLAHPKTLFHCSSHSLLPSSLLLLLLLLLPLLPLQFLCHLQVSLLEPSKAADANSTSPAGAVAHSTGHKAAVNSEAGAGGHHTEHAMTASGASKLRGLLKGHQEQDTAPPLTSRYIRVVNTFDVSAGVAVVSASLLT
jgi:hypothetical protein